MVAIALTTLPAGAVAAGRVAAFARNAADAGQEAAEVLAAGAAQPLPANTPGQIRKAQTELRRLDCLNGRIDGKLGDQTREALRKFRAMAKQPGDEVDITDGLIADLARHRNNFCRPPRRFFGFGGHGLPPLFSPGLRPGPVPPAAARPPAADAGEPSIPTGF
jgi:peptidoglycan hydrolase-like protein with peptidoglycan-binding domain